MIGVLSDYWTTPTTSGAHYQDATDAGEYVAKAC